MIELLRRAALHGAQHPAVLTNDRAVSYSDLLTAAEGVAAQLSAEGITRFGIVADDTADVVALIAGAALVGAEPCVYPPAESATEVHALAERFDHGVLITDRDDLDGVRTIRAAELTGGNAGAGAHAEPPARQPLLVLTTGTTGTPKGARHDWSRLLRRLTDITPASDERWLLAYGLHQFGGIQVLMHVFAAQATLVAPFPRRPREGLAAMREHRVDRVSATPTYWRFLLAELRNDGREVPALRQVTLGGEAVSGRLLDDLAEAFPKARISQIYGSSETNNLRGIRDGLGGLPVSVLDANPDADVQAKIVDGQLWIKSAIGMLGYYGEDDYNAGDWRPTGDLVEVVDDRIMFKGRTSDVINVGGVKVHPLPIERRVWNVPGVALARVYGSPNAVTGAIVAVDVVPEPGTDTDALDAAIREACMDLPREAHPRRVRFVDELPVMGNKIMRREPVGEL